jgi:serine protease Do
MLMQSRGGRLVLRLVVSMLAIAWAGCAWGADSAKKTPPVPEQEAGDAATTSYWLGILVAPADTVLKLHLRLEAGVVVEQIVPDSPAAKAGIQVNDILLRFGDAPLADVDGLQRAVGENRDREVQVTLLRAGKEQTTTVKPAPRPADAGAALPTRSGDWGQITEMLRRLERGEFGEDPLRMFFVQPGFVLPKDFKQRRLDLFTSPPELFRLPQGTRVSISRQDEGPAQITVEQDGRKWEVTEEELDQLPEDVRPAVKGMLGGGRVYVFGRSPVVVPGEKPSRSMRESPPDESGKPLEATPNSSGKNLHDVRDQLESMQRQLRENEQRIQKHLDELRQQLDGLGQPQD